MIEIKPADIEDVSILASILREEDKEEIIACGYTSYQGLELSYRNSFIVNGVYEDEKIIGMFGAVKVTKDWVRVWFLGSRECEKHPFKFIKEGKKFINYLTNDYAIFNQVYKKNVKHIEFLKALGVTVIDTGAIDGFYEFYKLRKM